MFSLPILEELYNQISKDHNIIIFKHTQHNQSLNMFCIIWAKCKECNIIFYITVASDEFKHVHCGYGTTEKLKLNCSELIIKNIIG